MSARTPKSARQRPGTSSSAYPAARPSAASSAGIEAERAAQAIADASAAQAGATTHLFRCPDCGRHHSEPAEAHWLLVVVCVDCAHDAAYRAAATPA